jgi:hypothetical protein
MIRLQHVFGGTGRMAGAPLLEQDVHRARADPDRAAALLADRLPLPIPSLRLCWMRAKNRCHCRITPPRIEESLRYSYQGSGWQNNVVSPR